MNKLIIPALVLSMIFAGCRDIFEKDLSKETVSLIFPADFYRTENTNITLQWYPVDGATAYELVLVSPRFDTAYSYYMDSTVTAEELTLTLDPGRYEWMVRAKNNAYQTPFSGAWQFEIDSSYNLNNQTLLLTSPVDGIYTNDTSLTFKWQSLYAADDYNFVLKEGGSWSTAVEVFNESLVVTSYTNTSGLTEGTYLWGVNASNAMPSETGFNEYRALYIDQTTPTSSLVVSPVSTTTGLYKDSTIAFDWYRYANNGTVNSPVSDSVLMYSDTLSTPIARLSCNTEDTTYVFTASGTYYWRLKTFDEAGNENDWTHAKKITIQ